MHQRTAGEFLVIFDCDGVLVDSEPIAVDIDVQICHEYGFEISREELIRRFMGRRAGLVWLALEEHLGRALTETERARNTERFRAAFEARLTAVSGVSQALDAIPYARCVASSSEPEPLRWKLEHCGLLHHFGEHVFSAAQVEHGKPAPDLFLFAAAQMGYAPGDCLVVEDSPYGLMAAQAAGMPALAFAGGMLPVSELDGFGAVVFDDMGALPQLLRAAAVGGPASPPTS